MKLYLKLRFELNVRPADDLEIQRLFCEGIQYYFVEVTHTFLNRSGLDCVRSCAIVCHRRWQNLYKIIRFCAFHCQL